MRKIGWKIYLLFACVFLVTLLVTAPATLLATLVDGVSKGQFVLANASGTVWQGSAMPAIRQRSGSLLAMEKLNWDVAMLPLLTGKLVIQLAWDNVLQAQPMVASISFEKIELRHAILPLNAEFLGEVSPLLKPVQLSGYMEISSPQFVLTRQGMAGNAVAEWTNAGSVLSAVKPLGNYRIDLVGAGTRLDLVLKTNSGVLLLEGKGSFTPEQGLKFKGTARASPDSKGGLDELLRNFGPESSPGVRSLNIMH